MFTVFHFKSLNIQKILIKLLLKHPLIKRVIKGDVKTCHKLIFTPRPIFKDKVFLANVLSCIVKMYKVLSCIVKMYLHGAQQNCWSVYLNGVYLETEWLRVRLLFNTFMMEAVNGLRYECV